MTELEKNAIKLLEKDCFTGDIEADHVKADQILCAFLKNLGYEKLVEKYIEVDKWYA